MKKSNTLSDRYPTQGYDALGLTKQKQIKHSVQG